MSVQGFMARYIGDHSLEANFQSMASRPDKKQPVPLHGGTGLFGALAGYAILINVIKGISSHLHSIVKSRDDWVWRAMLNIPKKE